MYPALYFLKYANRSSLLPAINLSQLSEFALILGTIGVSYNHISQDILSAFILASVTTALISSVIMPKAHSIYKKINPSLVFFGFQDQVIYDQSPDKVQSHSKVILLGFYKDASSFLHEILMRYSSDYAEGIHIVDFNPEAHGELKKRGIKCTYGDVSNIDTLRGLSLEKAEMIICSIPDKIMKGTTNLKMLMLLKQLAPDAIKIVTAENIDYAIKLYEEGADFVYFPRTISAQYLAEVIERINVEGHLTIKEDALNLLRNRKEVIP